MKRKLTAAWLTIKSRGFIVLAKNKRGEIAIPMQLTNHPIDLAKFRIALTQAIKSIDEAFDERFPNNRADFELLLSDMDEIITAEDVD